MKARRISRETILIAMVLLAAVLAGAVSAAGAEIPRKINYQARLRDSSTGEPYVGNANLTFRIYDDPVSGTAIWEESLVSTADSAGIVSAILGSSVPIDVDFNTAAWLEVEVDGEVLSPRREMVSVPYAFLALDADNLGGEPDSNYVLKGEPGSVTAEMIVGGTGSGLDADLLDSLSAEAFSDTGHTHDGLYYRKEELNTSGTINDSGNPVAWSKLKEVPAGFADGTDDTGGTGDGYSLDAADGSPTDAVYVDDVGNVGIGTTTPDDGLDVVGDADLTGDLKIGGTPVFSVDLSGNTVIGSGAGYGTSGTHNIFMGFGSGYANTTGSSNVFAGAYSGLANTIGSGNTLVGYSAGAANDSGWGNTCLGYLSGNANIDADINTFIGYYSGKSNTVGNGNTSVGAMSGWLNTDGEYNTWVGGGAGYSNAGGSGNTCLGYGAGNSNVNGDGNVFIGKQAGYMETGSNKLYIANGPNSSDVLVYGDFAAGKVGIGTTSPEEALDVNGAAKITAAGSPLKLHTDAGYIELESDNPDPMGLRLSNASRDWYLINGTGLNDRLSIYDGDAGEERFVIDGYSGKVGIGEPNPTSDLTINRNIPGVWPAPGYPALTIGCLSHRAASICLGDTADSHGCIGWFPNECLRLLSTHAIRFGVGPYGYGTETDVAIDEDGRVGIGTDFPEELLHIVGDNPRILLEAETSNPEINFKSAGDASAETWALYKESSNDDLYFLQDGTIRVALKTGKGALGIGTNNVGTYELYVQGEAYATGGWTPSDIRFKEDIAGIESPLEKVLGLKGVSFKWKTEEYGDRGFPEGEHYGVIAQDAEKVLPEIVKEGPDGGKAVAYSEIIPVLIESIRELKAENDAMRQRIAALETRGD
jgi:hypothetical protein